MLNLNPLMFVHLIFSTSVAHLTSFRAQSRFQPRSCRHCPWSSTSGMRTTAPARAASRATHAASWAASKCSTTNSRASLPCASDNATGVAREETEGGAAVTGNAKQPNETLQSKAKQCKTVQYKACLELFCRQRTHLIGVALG
mgnify:CR=1 FL=1